VAIIAAGRIRYEGAIDEFLEAGEPEADLVLAGLPPDTAVELEERFGAKLRGHGERIELRVAEKDASPAMRIALNAGARVVSSIPHRVSLESIFMTAVNESRVEETPS